MRRSGLNRVVPIIAEALIKKETPHMFMWFYDGVKIPDDAEILPKNMKFDYRLHLEEECRKLEVTKTPVYLIYMGRLLYDKQQEQMQDLATISPNLFVIDYDKVEGSLGISRDNSRIKTEIVRLVNNYKASGEVKDLQDLVGFVRLVLMYNSRAIGEEALILSESDSDKLNLDDLSQGIISRDFDVALGAETMPDIKAEEGYYTSCLLKESARNLCALSEQEQDRLGEFEEKYLSDAETLKRYIKLFSKDVLTLSTAEMSEIRSLNVAWRLSIGNPEEKGRNLKDMLVGNIVEARSSFIAVSDDENQRVKKSIAYYLAGGTISDAIQKYFICNDQRREAQLLEFLDVQKAVLKVGSHGAFLMNPRDLYSGYGSSNDVSMDMGDLYGRDDYVDHVQGSDSVIGGVDDNEPRAASIKVGKDGKWSFAGSVRYRTHRSSLPDEVTSKMRVAYFDATRMSRNLSAALTEVIDPNAPRGYGNVLEKDFVKLVIEFYQETEGVRTLDMWTSFAQREGNLGFDPVREEYNFGLAQELSQKYQKKSGVAGSELSQIAVNMYEGVVNRAFDMLETGQAK